MGTPMLKKLIQSFAALLTVASVNAQSMPEGFYIRGNIQAEYLSDGATNLTTGAADFVLGYKASGISSLPVGIEVGVYQFGSDFISFDHVITPVLFIDTQFGRFSAGVPRPALDDYIQQSRYANSIYWDFTAAGSFSSSYADAVHKYIGMDSHGVRFDGARGALRYGISVHRIGGLDWLTAAANYTAGQFVFAGGVEMAETVPRNGYFASVQANFGQFSGRVSYVESLAVAMNFTEITGTYNPLANLTFEVGHLMFSTGTSFTNGSVKYDLPSGTYIGANVVSMPGASSLFGIFTGWDFSYGG